jgi:hypothetical protein
MPTAAAVAYVIYCLACLGYAIFILAASLLSRPYRDRVHRGSWLHVAEGWALVGALWAAYAWGVHALRVGELTRSGLPPLSASVSFPAGALWFLLPLAVATTFVMAVTTIVHLWRPRPEQLAQTGADSPKPRG